ncbi:MAG: DNA primase, partial [bacterium]|nr:DNA primase [bacterium]
MPPRNSSSEVERVREATDIVEVISRYVNLTQKPGGQFVGLCPFHEDSKPSFSVSPDKQLYYCFGCGAGGNVFGFLEKVEGFSFGEALRRLARDAGIELKGGPSKKRDNETERLKKLLSISNKFYREYLTEKSKEESVAARAYLDDRKVTEEAIKRFRVGLAPDAWDTLTVKATRAGYSPDELVKAGLAVPRKEGSGIYDRFRNRLLFPIYNSLGEPVGFGGRDLSGEEDVPKYINSPNSPIYNKSRTIYNLDKARLAIAAQNRIVVVEGYFDVLGLWQVGIENAVATSGTALNEDIARLLVRFSKDIVMLFDGDAAGQAATRRAVTGLLKNGARVRVVVMPPGKDPFDISITEGRAGTEKLLD